MKEKFGNARSITEKYETLVEGITSGMEATGVKRREKNTSGMVTIYTTEAIGVEKAIEIANKEMEEKDVTIFTDPLSVLQGIRGIEKKDKGNPDEYDERIWRIRKALVEKDKRNKGEGRKSSDKRIGSLQIAWIPAHNGIEGNERADASAKQLTGGEPEREIKIPWRDIKVELKERAWKRSREDMERIGEEKRVKYFTRRENNIGSRRPWFIKMTGMGRKEISFLNRIRANRYNLAESLFRKGMVETRRLTVNAMEG